VSTTSFLDFAELCKRLEATRSRNEKVQQISRFISSLQPTEVPFAARFLTGRVLGEQGAKTLGVGAATLWRLAKADSLQVYLLPTETRLSILDVGKAFESLSSLSGPTGNSKPRIFFRDYSQDLVSSRGNTSSDYSPVRWR